jgi:hypothetical protein
MSMERVASANTKRKVQLMHRPLPEDNVIEPRMKNGHKPEPIPRYSVEVTLTDNISDDVINETIADFDELVLAEAAFQQAKGLLEKSDGQVKW